MDTKHGWALWVILALMPALGVAQNTSDIRTRSLEALIADLRVDNIPGNSTRAMRELMRRPIEETVPLLDAALWSDDWQQRLCAARVLCEGWHLHNRPVRAYEVLIENLGTDDRPGNATAALRAMMVRDVPDQARAWLRQDLESADPQRRFHAAVILTHEFSESFTPRMCEILIENLGADGIRGNAAEARWALHRRTLCALPPECLAPFEAALDSPDAQVRVAAAQVLARVGEQAGTPELLELLLNDFPACDDEFTACATLRVHGELVVPLGPSTIAALERAMNSDCARLRFVAARIVSYEGARMSREMQGQMVGVLIDNLRQDGRRDNAVIARDILQSMSPPPNFVLTGLDRALGSRDHQQSQMAAMILTGFCREGEIEPSSRLCATLVEAFHDEGGHRDPDSGRWVEGPWPVVPGNQGNAVWFLLHLRPDVGTEALEAALDSSDPHQQLMAASILAQTGRIDRLEDISEILLINLVADHELGNASRACGALSRMGPTVAPILEMFINYEHDQQLRYATRLALANVMAGVGEQGDTRFGSMILRSSLVHDPELLALVGVTPGSQ